MDRLIGEHGLSVTKVIVSEAGASIYSASELASREFPNLDLTIRGAISIARRLQDPLAELVKTDPKSIGIGQYQHDVNQTQLRKCLDRVVESCVSTVGVDLNTASVPLLSYVAGIGPKLAENIVAYRDSHGEFSNRRQLAKVPKLGKKAFEQAAGFLRIQGGDEPLDNSAVHPESYAVVARMARKLGSQTRALVGNAALSQKLRPEDFMDQQFGLPTIMDIISELAKPGRDPRSQFRVAQFNPNVNSVEDVTCWNGAGGRDHQRYAFWRIRGYRRSSRRPDSHFPTSRQIHQRPQRGRSGRRRSPCQSLGGGYSTQAHRRLPQSPRNKGVEGQVGFVHIPAWASAQEFNECATEIGQVIGSTAADRISIDYHRCVLENVRPH